MKKTITLSKDEVEQLILDKLDVDTPQGTTIVTTLDADGATIVLDGLKPE